MLMKQLLSVVLALCLLLSLAACGKKEEITKTEPVTTQTPEPEPTPTPDPVPDPTPDPVPDPVPEVLYRDPLDGTPLEEPWNGRVVTVALGNTKDALPQKGINDAAILYEAETEGGTTRFLAVFSNAGSLPAVGPVRSARTFFNSLTRSYDGIILHCGGSDRGRNGYHDLSGSKIENWENIDARFHDASADRYRDTMFYRDGDRRSAGYNFEHTMFIQGNAITHLIGKYEYRTSAQENYTSGLQFAEDVALEGSAATSVTVSFAAYKTTSFLYNKESGLYMASQYQQDLIDGNTGEISAFKNLIVLETEQFSKRDSNYYRSYYTLLGSGDAHLVINGQMVSIKWARENLDDPFTYTFEDGTPVQLAPGRTYVAITSADESIVCQ